MSLRGVFIAGTDTGVGKSCVSAGLARAAVADGQRVEVMKPVAAGAELTPQGLRNDDALELMAAAGSHANYEDVNPFCLSLAASPHVAAAEAGMRIDTGEIRRAAERLAAGRWLLVEGAGGWYAPIGAQDTMADVALALALPVVLVVGLRLGCLNHAQLSVEAIRRGGLRFAGWIGNAIDPGMGRMDASVDWLSERYGDPFALLPWLDPSERLGSRPAELLATASRRLLQL